MKLGAVLGGVLASEEPGAESSQLRGKCAPYKRTAPHVRPVV